LLAVEVADVVLAVLDGRSEIVWLDLLVVVGGAEENVELGG